MTRGKDRHEGAPVGTASDGPTRWKDLGDEAPRAARLLLHAKPPSAMSGAERERIEARLQTSDAASAQPASAALPLAKGGALLALIVAVGFGANALVALAPAGNAPVTGRQATSSPMPPQGAPHSARVDSPTSDPPTTMVAGSSADGLRPREGSSVSVEDLPSASIAKASRRRVATSTATTVQEKHEERRDEGLPADPLLREVVMLDATRALLSRDPAAALAQLDAQNEEFATGQLAAERELLSVRVLVQLGRNADARARGEAFMRRHGTSPYSEQMRRELAALSH